MFPDTELVYFVLDVNLLENLANNLQYHISATWEYMGGVGELSAKKDEVDKLEEILQNYNFSTTQNEVVIYDEISILDYLKYVVIDQGFYDKLPEETKNLIPQEKWLTH